MTTGEPGRAGGADRGRPRAVRRVLVVLVGAGAYAVLYLALVLVGALVFGELSWTRGLGSFLGAVAGSTIVLWWRQRGQSVAVDERRDALRSGQIPAGAEGAEWRRALLRDRRIAALGARWGPVGCAVMAVVWVAVVATSDLGVVGWLVLVAVVVAGVLLAWVGGRNTRRLDALLQRLPPG